MVESYIVKDNNLLKLIVDGNEVPTFAYMTYIPKNGMYDWFKSKEIKLFSLGVYMGDRGINPMSGIRPFRSGFWKNRDIFDFSEVEADFEGIVGGDSMVYILPRVYLDCPKWWEKENPDQLSRDYGGNAVRQSFASPLWREDCAKALEKFREFIENSKWEKYIIGYHIAAGSTEEWLYPRTFKDQVVDYSEINRMSYIKWLKTQYGNTIDDLNRSWKTNYENFERICIPSPIERKYSTWGPMRNPEWEGQVIDYSTYHNELMADTIVYFCRKVKELTHWKQIIGAFYGYVGEVTDNEMGHHALSKLLDASELDFLASPCSYMDGRAKGIDWPFMTAAESLKLHNKLYFNEADIRTCLTRPLKEMAPGISPENKWYENGVWKGPETINESISALKKGFSRVMLYGTGLWWFDMWGGWFDHPDIKDFLEKANSIYREAYIKGGYEQNSEIAVIIDDRSYSYFKPGSNVLHELVYNQRRELGRMGAPYHLYLLRDIDILPKEQYKLFIFLNICNIPQNTKNFINNSLKADNRILMWIYLPDVFHENKINTSESITDIKYTVKDGTEFIQIVANGITYPEKPVEIPYICIEQENNNITLGHIKNEERPGLLVKKSDGWSSVWSLAPCIPASILRELAVLSGVHIYSHTDDVIYSNSRYIAMHVACDGDKRVYLPRWCDVYDVFTNEPVKIDTNFFDFQAKAGETYLWSMK